MRRALRPADPRLWILILVGLGLLGRAAPAGELVRGYHLEAETCAPGRPCRPMPSRGDASALPVCLSLAESLRERLASVRTAAGATIAVRCALAPGLPRA